MITKRSAAIGGGVVGLAALVYWLWPSEGRARRAVVRAAVREPGDKPRVAEYWKAALGHDGEHPPDWCGALPLWALKRAGLARDLQWEVGKGFLYHLPTTSVPKPGDIAYFNKNQHHAIVQAVNSDGTVSLINGNGTQGHITQSRPNRSAVTAFYSIKPLITKGK